MQWSTAVAPPTSSVLRQQPPLPIFLPNLPPSRLYEQNFVAVCSSAHSVAKRKERCSTMFAWTKRGACKLIESAPLRQQVAVLAAACGRPQRKRAQSRAAG
mmetsp:Transcript_23810/g.39354  ORF Transcript_23810/g.39354 Transcript_23810/m.39354 type:complete len:101 (-) Transcript_23810:2221-2523(-)